MGSKPTCCKEHLARTNRGVIGRSGEFIINRNHCVDGERARCLACRTTWEHICDEAEGCAWHEVIPRNKARA